MEIPNSFARTLAKLEGRVKKLNMALHNTRHLYELGDQEMTYAVAMRLADTAEQVTLLARALPACTGNPIAAQELQDVMAINVPVEMGFTKEGWFSVRLPLLLPKKGACKRRLYPFNPVSGDAEIFPEPAAGPISGLYIDLPACLYAEPAGAQTQGPRQC